MSPISFNLRLVHSNMISVNAIYLFWPTIHMYRSPSHQTPPKRCQSNIDPPSSIHCGPTTPCCDINLSQHWWLVAWRHHAITWTNVSFAKVQWHSHESKFRPSAHIETKMPSIWQNFRHVMHRKLPFPFRFRLLFSMMSLKIITYCHIYLLISW